MADWGGGGGGGGGLGGQNTPSPLEFYLSNSPFIKSLDPPLKYQCVCVWGGGGGGLFTTQSPSGSVPGVEGRKE